MEISIASLPILLLVAFMLLKLGSKLISHKSSCRNLPPGPWKLPLIGNLHNLIGALPHRALHELALKHGALMHLRLGEVSAVVVSSADAAKEVMKTHDINFASLPPILASEMMSYDGSSISFAPYGDYWRQRKICALELLSAKCVESFGSLREEVYLDLAKWIASMEGSAVGVSKTEQQPKNRTEPTSSVRFGPSHPKFGSASVCLVKTELTSVRLWFLRSKHR